MKLLPAEYYLEGWRTVSLALIAVDQALKDARLADLSGFRVGVCMGTTVASQLNALQFYKKYRESGAAPMTSVDRFLKGNLAEYIARRIGARGPQISVVNACSSGTDAIGIALSWLKSGLCDIAIAGGADELNHVPYCGFNSLGIANPGLCAPFDRDRKGLNLGEGAGVMVIETRETARKRGASSRLFLAGYGSSSDAYHLTAPSPEGVGLRAALHAALAEAGIEPGSRSVLSMPTALELMTMIWSKERCWRTSSDRTSSCCRPKDTRDIPWAPQAVSRPYSRQQDSGKDGCRQARVSRTRMRPSPFPRCGRRPPSPDALPIHFSGLRGHQCRDRDRTGGGRMKITGIGMISSQGLGIASLREGPAKRMAKAG